MNLRDYLQKQMISGNPLATQGSIMLFAYLFEQLCEKEGYEIVIGNQGVGIKKLEK